MVFNAEQSTGKPEKAIQCDPIGIVFMGGLKKANLFIQPFQQYIGIKIGLERLVILFRAHDRRPVERRRRTARSKGRHLKLLEAILSEIGLDARQIFQIPGQPLLLPVGNRLLPPGGPFDYRQTVNVLFSVKKRAKRSVLVIALYSPPLHKFAFSIHPMVY